MTESTGMDGVQHGDRICGTGADEKPHMLRALGGVVADGDFEVVWACGELEWREWRKAVWDESESEDREPEGFPWPVEDLEMVRHGPISDSWYPENDPGRYPLT